MKQIMLRIRKKTLVPTKRAIKHQYRSDWITVGTVSYAESYPLFKFINGVSGLETDADLAKLIKKNFGTGIYSVLGFQKGRSGFWSFMKVECKENTFIRLSKTVTQEMKEAMQLHTEYNRLKTMFKQATSSDVKEDLSNQIHDLEEDLNLTKEIINLEKGKTGCYPYLYSIKPVYREHSYEQKGYLEYEKNKRNTIKKEEKIPEPQIQQAPKPHVMEELW
jgi:hypothetical protein